jgi:hypothetical protein
MIVPPQVSYEIVRLLAVHSPFTEVEIYDAWRQTGSLDRVMWAVNTAMLTGTNLHTAVIMIQHQDLGPVQPD